MIIVSDTSPLSGLAITGHLALLQEIYSQVVIPPAVENELQRGIQDDPRINQALIQNWIEIRSPSDRLLVETLQQDYNLDRGESEAIALSLELHADELLIDERLGRREALRLGLSITGLLGFLLIAKQKGLIRAVRPIVDDLIKDARFRISTQLYQEVLLMAREED